MDGGSPWGETRPMVIARRTANPCDASAMATSRRAALYVRVSTSDRGQTVDNQLQPLQEAAGRLGWTVVAIRTATRASVAPGAAISGLDLWTSEPLGATDAQAGRTAGANCHRTGPPAQRSCRPGGKRSASLRRDRSHERSCVRWAVSTASAVSSRNSAA
jgi:hypothetical protein